MNSAGIEMANFNYINYFTVILVIVKDNIAFHYSILYNNKQLLQQTLELQLT